MRMADLQWIMDRFGHKDDSFRNVLTAGDLDFRDGRVRTEEDRRLSAKLVKDLEIMAEIMKRELARHRNGDQRSAKNSRLIKELRRRYRYFNVNVRETVEIRTRNVLFHLILSTRDGSELEIQDGLDELESLWQPHIFERQNLSPSWRNVIRLSITSRHKNQKFHQLPFNCKLHEAVKILNKLLVCRGNPVVNVKTLRISNSGYILRMPVNLKLKINNLDGKVENSFCKALNKIIHESSYPLNRVYVNCISDDVNVLDHPLIRDAKTLNVNDVTLPRQQRLPLLLNMQNPTVLVDSVGFLETNGMIALIRNLMGNFRPIGHKIRLNVLGFNTAFEILKQFANQFDRTRIRCRNITIPMNHISTLQVSYAPKNRKTRDNGHFYLDMIVLSNNN